MPLKPLTAEGIAELRRCQNKQGYLTPHELSNALDALPRLLDEVERARALLKRIQPRAYGDPELIRETDDFVRLLG